MTTQLPTNFYEFFIDRFHDLLGGEDRIPNPSNDLKEALSYIQRLEHLKRRVKEFYELGKEAAEKAEKEYEENYENPLEISSYYHAIQELSFSLFSYSVDPRTLSEEHLLELDDLVFLIKFFATQIQRQFLPSKESYMKLLAKQYDPKEYKDYVESINKCLGSKDRDSA